jgi:hypothetical protein
MDAGKVKVVLNALREELHSRRATAAEPGGAQDDPVLDAHANAGADPDSDHGADRNHPRRAAPRETNGILVDLSSEARATAMSVERAEEAPAGADFSQRPIPELVVPFFVPDEPFVIVAPYLIRAVLAAAVAGILMLFFM